MNSRIQVIRRADVPGLTVKLLDYQLFAAEKLEVSGCENHHVLSMRAVDFGKIRTTRCLGTGTPYIPLGRLGYAPAHTPWRIESVGVGNGQAVACYFDPHVFDKIADLPDDCSREYLNACLALDSPVIATAMERILQEMIAPGFSSHLVLEALGKLLTIEIARYFKSLPESPQSIRGRRLASWQLRTIRRRTEDSEQRELSVTQLAQDCAVSIDYLRRAFRNTTGQTLGAYLESAKMARAKIMLTESDKTLKEIAHHLGFANPSSFSVAFRRETGYTPKDYQRRSRQ